MNVNRRTFLAATAATVAAGTASSARGQGSSTKYKACIIGDSKQGGYGHHIDLAFALREDVAVVGLADPDEAGRAKHGKEAGAARTYADYREMLEKERPDVVGVGPRWSVNHRDYLLACAEVGAHGLIEKPLCIDLEEGDAMLEAIGPKNLKWAIAFNVRATPIVQHLKRLIWEEGLIGTVLEARGRGKEDHRAGGEDLIVLGAHVLDMMAFLMNASPEWCFADLTWNGKPAAPADVRDPTEPLGPVVGDRIHAVYGFKEGAVGHFDSMKNPDGNRGRFGLDVYGSRGVVTIRFDAAPRVYWLEDGAWAPGEDGPNWQPLPRAAEFTFPGDAAHRNKPIVDDLIAAIEQDRRPAVSLQDGLRAQEMIQAVFESHVQRGRVDVPLAERSHPLKRWG